MVPVLEVDSELVDELFGERVVGDLVDRTNDVLRAGCGPARGRRCSGLGQRVRRLDRRVANPNVATGTLAPWSFLS